MGDARQVLVTGGSGGIGSAVVRALARDGLEVIFTYWGRSDAAISLRDELVRDGYLVRAERCNLADWSDVMGFAKALNDSAPNLYGLVCNAGASLDALVALVNLDEARKLFELNFFANVELVKVLSRGMARRKSGRIVFVGSVTSTLGNRGNATYGASKAALEGFMRSIVPELAPRGVSVNCVRPGFIDTPLLSLSERRREELLERIPARRLGQPEDVAELLRFLLRKESSYVNGAVLTVDGGLSATSGV